MATIGTTSRPAYVYDQETDTWVPVGVGPHTHENFVAATTIDAKGDLLAGSAPDTIGKLTIGTNGTLLVADSTQTLGMAWKNDISSLIINSTTSRGSLHSVGQGTFNPTTGNVWATTAAFTASGNFGGGLTFVDGSAGAGIWARDSGATLAFGLGTVAGNLTEYMRLNSSGNLGIGKTPTTRLDVNGTINGSNVTINGSGVTTTGKAIAMAIVFGG